MRIITHSRQDVYFQFGSKLPEGTWSIVVSEPGNGVLGTETQEVSAERANKLWDITQFSNSSSGVYKVKVTIVKDNDKGKETTIKKSDTLKMTADFDIQDPRGDGNPQASNGDGDSLDSTGDGNPEESNGDSNSQEPKGNGNPKDSHGNGDSQDSNGDGDSHDLNSENDIQEQEEDEDVQALVEENEAETAVRPRNDRGPRIRGGFAAIVLEEEIPRTILEAETDEEIADGNKEPLDLPFTGATNGCLIGLLMNIITDAFPDAGNKLLNCTN